MTAPLASPTLVDLDQLRVGEVIAEGGEGRVHLLPRQPHLLYKAYRRPGPRTHLEELVAWPGQGAGPAGAAVVRAGSAWPTSVVVRGDEAVGLLVPRAPRRFAVRHRDGHSRLASLSYLTTDPAHRAAAYGLVLPPPAAAERVGLVYALARLLMAFESGRPSVGHGDLSTKNVLWSLQRGPEVFVIDCDSAELFGPDHRPVGTDVGRRRAMTPNWDDPAVERGRSPGATTDRYSLALVFLRVVGAANFPVQARQRTPGPVEVRFPVPPAAEGALLDPDAPVWALCTRALSVTDPGGRPPAAEWVAALEDVLGSMGAAATAAAARAAQGGDVTSPAAAPAGGGAPRAVGAGVPGDVRVVPVRAPRRRRPIAPAVPAAGSGAPPRPSPAVGYRRATPSPAPAAGAATPSARVWPELRVEVVRFLRWWAAIHRARKLRAVALFLVVDLTILVVGAVLVALIVSPVIEG